jgi:small subunit ribosomal protein S5
MPELLEDTQALESTTVGIFRTATVVKGGRRFSFAALVVVGDRRGSVGVGYGKGRGVPVAIEKAQKAARKNLVRIRMKDGTLPHAIEGKFGASKVRILPAAPGTGVIAGGTARAVLEMAGIQDCLTKAYGSTNKKNLCKAVLDGLTRLRTKEQVASHRGVEIETTAVDEMIAIGQRYTTTTAAPKQVEAPAKEKQEDSGKRGGRGGGRRGGGRQRETSVPGGKGVKATVTTSNKPQPPKPKAAPAEEAKPEGEAPPEVQAEAPVQQPQAEAPVETPVEQPKQDAPATDTNTEAEKND